MPSTRLRLDRTRCDDFRLRVRLTSCQALSHAHNNTNDTSSHSRPRRNLRCRSRSCVADHATAHHTRLTRRLHRHHGAPTVPPWHRLCTIPGTTARPAALRRPRDARAARRAHKPCAPLASCAPHALGRGAAAAAAAAARSRPANDKESRCAATWRGWKGRALGADGGRTLHVVDGPRRRACAARGEGSPRSAAPGRSAPMPATHPAAARRAASRRAPHSSWRHQLLRWRGARPRRSPRP